MPGQADRRTYGLRYQGTARPFGPTLQHRTCPSSIINLARRTEGEYAVREGVCFDICFAFAFAFAFALLHGCVQ
ncbi:hypothetical protein BofuT4_uP098530.1 [Botrytis cinerea T4]|uniref:Uncharacterized protein n=1 Tax=Botryotinia fuckeliana (strain T4) TaxID=999810 RepID=G2YCG5_BOTF4|nr:hypothetical protein BofuT4_uP098530.1 [Botrytis cinerea T4]